MKLLLIVYYILSALYVPFNSSSIKIRNLLLNITVVAQSSDTLVSIPSGCWLLIISLLTMIHTLHNKLKKSGNSMISSQSKQETFLCSTRLCPNFCMGGSAIEYFNTQKLVCNCKISHCLSYHHIFCRGGLLH